MNAKDILKLREQRKALEAKIGEIVDVAEKENRDFTDTESADIKTYKEDISALDTKIDDGLAAHDKAKEEDEARSKKEAEARRDERMRKLEKEQEERERRVARVGNTSSNNDTEIRVADHFPMTGRAPESFIAAYGNEQRGRAEAYRSGMWALGAIFGNEEARKWSRDYGYRALNGSVSSAGAILVPDGLMNSIIWNVDDRGVFARNANIVQMGQNDTLLVPKSTGEVTAYAVSENQTTEVTESEPTTDGVDLTSKTWGLLTRLSRNLNDDAVINIGEYLGRKFGYAIADKQDQAGFNGDGTSTYHGISGVTAKVNNGDHAGSIHTALAANTGFGTLDLEDFEAVVGKLPQKYEGDDVAWYISKPGFYASMARLMDAAGGNTQDNVAGGKGLQFLGYPVRISTVLFGTLGAQINTIVALFGSLRRTAMYAQKKELSIQVLTEKYATYNQIGLLGFTRFGINVHELGDGTNAGAMIALKTPGS